MFFVFSYVTWVIYRCFGINILVVRLVYPLTLLVLFCGEKQVFTFVKATVWTTLVTTKKHFYNDCHPPYIND